MVSRALRKIIIEPLKNRISKIRKEMKKAKGRETKKMLHEELDYCEEMMDKYKGKRKARTAKAKGKVKRKSPAKKKKPTKKPVKKRKK